MPWWAYCFTALRVGHSLEQVSGEMDPAALPVAALQLPADGLGQADVRVADHELDPSEAALLERPNELAPEALDIAVALLDAEQLTPAVSVEAHGHDDRPGADLHRFAVTPVEAGGIEVQVGVAGGLKGAVREDLHLSMSAQMRLT